jgi:bacterioferritin
MYSEAGSTVDMLNGLLGVYYTALAQHQSHVALLDSWGLAGLARSMEARIADEPITIAAVMQRLLDLGGMPNFTLGTPNIGSSVGEVLDKDLEIQRLARPGLNAAAEAASADHDATTRVVLEGILADEEKHLAWLEAERVLLDRLGEPLYFANRMGTPSSTPTLGAV